MFTTIQGAKINKSNIKIWVCWVCFRCIFKAKPTDVAQVGANWSVNSPPSHWRRVWSQPSWRSSPPSTDQGTRPLRSPDGHSSQWLNHLPHFKYEPIRIRVLSLPAGSVEVARGCNTDFTNKETVDSSSRQGALLWFRQQTFWIWSC